MKTSNKVTFTKDVKVRFIII